MTFARPLTSDGTASRPPTIWNLAWIGFCSIGREKAFPRQSVQPPAGLVALRNLATSAPGLRSRFGSRLQSYQSKVQSYFSNT